VTASSQPGFFVRCASGVVRWLRTRDGRGWSGLRTFGRICQYRFRRLLPRELDTTVLGASRNVDPRAIISPADVIRRETVESLLAGANDYYKSAIAQGATSFLKRKPFHAFDESPQVLVRLGMLLRAARLVPGMHVVEFGAGVGWLSAAVWQMGAHVICVDASEAALQLAREAFAEHRANLAWSEATAKTALTDGHRLPLPDESVDRVVCFDVFHHVPNQEEILREFYRVLRQGGIACFSEPGRYHSTTASSQDEMTYYRVLENDIVVEDVWALARSIGFTDIAIQPMLDSTYSLSIQEYLSLMNSGRAGLRGREALTKGTLSTSSFCLHKGELVLDSRDAGALGASVRAPESIAAVAGVPMTTSVNCTNTGTGRWLARMAYGTERGVVNVGIIRCDEDGHPLERDWRRAPLPRDVEPGESITVECELAFAKPGRMTIRFDLVSEGVAWFHAACTPDAVPVNVVLP
jgi:ubiquinone/menaquinone biosynthesis C-methylase UbiE